MSLADFQSIQKPTQFPAADSDNPGAVFFGPTKLSLFQTTVIQPEAVVIPVENLNFVPAPVAENKKRGREGVQREAHADQSRQSVDGFAHIRDAAG